MKIVDLEKKAIGIFPWFPILGIEFVRAVKHIGIQRVDTVIDLCCGQGYLGGMLAEVLKPHQVMAVDIDSESCNIAEKIFREKGNFKVIVVQQDVSYFVPKVNYAEKLLIISNPPCVPLPDTLSHLRNVYGGKDGLFIVRSIFKNIFKIKTNFSFIISTFFISNSKGINYKHVQKKLNLSTGKNITFKILFPNLPAWSFRGLPAVNPIPLHLALKDYLSLLCLQKKWTRIYTKKGEYKFLYHIFLVGMKNKRDYP